MAGKLIGKHEKMFEQMLAVDAVRGTDSTGILAVRRDNSQKIAKAVGDPYVLYGDRSSAGIFHGTQKLLLGHNRWATSGKVTRHTAHPFDFDDLAGVHNGTLENKYVLDDASLFTVDSENLYHDIQNNGIRASIAKVRGAWALVWWDKKEERLCFLRNEQRPLSLIHDEDGNLYWASEKKMLEWMIDRNGIKCKEEVWDLKENCMLSIHLDKNGNLCDYKVEKEVNGAPPFVPQQHRTPTSPSSVTKTTAPTGTSPEKQECSTEQPASGADEAATDIIAVGKIVDVAFQQQKGLLMEYVCKARDENGQDFCILFSEQYPQHIVRLYQHSSHALQTQPEGTLVSVDIGKAHMTKHGIYYKANPWSLKVLGEQEDPTKILEMVEYETFKDSDGSYLNTKAFKDKYKQCDVCREALDPVNGYRFTTQNDILCFGCVHEYDGMVSFK